MENNKRHETPSKINDEENEHRTPRRQSALLCRARMANMQANPQKYDSPIRKSSRKITPTKRYDDEHTVATPRKYRIKRPIKVLQHSSESESETDDEVMECNAMKTIDLFTENCDVEGKNLYGFNTPKKRFSMLKLALNTPKTPKLMTPSTSETSTKRDNVTNNLQPKTPSLIRTKIKKQISKHVQNFESDFSGDESEYKPNTSSNDSDSQHTSSSDESVTRTSDSESKKENKSVKRNVIRPRKSMLSQYKQNTRRSVRKLNEYIPESEGYFISHVNNKIMTSNHTLDRLRNPRLPAEHLFHLLNSLKLTTEHQNSISKLFDEYKMNFTKWMYILDQGFNILLYGLGSKRDLLQNFQSEMLENRTVIVINGFFPSLTIKNILDSILIDILDLTSSPVNLNEAVNVIEDEMILIPETHVFLIVHNIDGSMLRNSKAQDLLSRLAKIKNIHLLASIDHLNAPLLWDQTKLSNYNFTWWDVTTMLPYTNETAFENSLMVQNSGELALSSMRNVFLSLTTNARGIYLLIVKNQLKNKGNSNYQGILFKDLYWGCRDAFLVSSDLALRAQLTEFIDHKLVRSKRNMDGSETLQIPILNGLLQQFLDEQETNT